MIVLSLVVHFDHRKWVLCRPTSCATAVLFTGLPQVPAPNCLADSKYARDRSYILSESRGGKIRWFFVVESDGVGRCVGIMGLSCGKLKR